VGEGGLGAPLLAQEPGADRRAVGVGEKRRGVRAARQGVHRQGRDPRGQVGVDGPGAVRTDVGAQKLRAALRHDVVGQPARRQTHRDERREGRGFEEPAGAGVDAEEDVEDTGNEPFADPGPEILLLFRPAVADQADGDESRNGIADHG